VAGRWIARVLVLPIRLYQLLFSPMLGPRCRFYPSCSAYAVEALQRHGRAARQLACRAPARPLSPVEPRGSRTPFPQRVRGTPGHRNPPHGVRS
jgi:hypothetical protein